MKREYAVKFIGYDSIDYDLEDILEFNNLLKKGHIRDAIHVAPYGTEIHTKNKIIRIYSRGISIEMVTKKIDYFFEIPWDRFEKILF